MPGHLIFYGLAIRADADVKGGAAGACGVEEIDALDAIQKKGRRRTAPKTLGETPYVQATGHHGCTQPQTDWYHLLS